MIIYESDFLEIDKWDDLLVQRWKTRGLNAEKFQSELLHYNDLSQKVRPKNVLWLQENFDLTISKEIYEWIGDNIIKKQFKMGLSRQSFTFPHEDPAMFSMLDFFEEVDQIFYPSYYTSKSTALESIKKSTVEESFAPKLTIEKYEEEVEIRLRIKPEDLQFAVNFLSEMHEEQLFKLENREKFESLTLREIEIFNLIISGFNNEKMADMLSVAKETISSHRKSIIKKLQIRNLADWINYAHTFRVKAER